MASKRDVQLDDGRVVVAHDATPDADPDMFAVIWHHGSPQTGALLDPLVQACAERGIRLVSYARPSYGGSTDRPGRDVASAASDVAQVADALGIGQFAVMGGSGGGPHALACAALLPNRVSGVVCLASPAPLTDAFDWFAGMLSPGGPGSALAGGRAARARYAETEEFDENQFIAADWAALQGAWSSLGADAGAAGRAGPDGLIDDDVALVTPWGFELAQIQCPVLLVQGGLDRVIPPSHGEWLAGHIPHAELWRRPEDGHVSVLDACPAALDWLLANAQAE
jgi:pimeloyl-ACP methyl ester carboxylesterase